MGASIIDVHRTQSPVADAAAFHCQQAAEKLLKGFLVHAGLDFGKTHDLGRLVRVVAAHFPSVALLVSTMDDWTAWNIAYRYPDLAEPHPSAEELLQAFDVIAAPRRGAAIAWTTKCYPRQQ
jgi:HEPN domain-containing protein